MGDLVVTVPKTEWSNWLAEGDWAGYPATGTEYVFMMYGKKPNISPGNRLYVVAHERLRGWAPVVAVRHRIIGERTQWGVFRRGGAVACTLPERIKGFRGFRYPWFQRDDLIEFPDWRTP